LFVISYWVVLKLLISIIFVASKFTKTMQKIASSSVTVYM